MLMTNKSGHIQTNSRTDIYSKYGNQENNPVFPKIPSSKRKRSLEVWGGRVTVDLRCDEKVK